MPTAKFAEFIQHRKEFIRIDDFETYKRARVQLHWRDIVLRDEIEGAAVKTKEQQVARDGDLLVAEIDAKVGGVGILPPALDGAIVSSHYFLFEINESKCLRRWLDFYIRSGLLEDQLVARGSTNYAAIRPHHVLACEIPVPTLPEQRRIVARIEELAAKIAEARGLRQQAMEEAGALWTRHASDVFDRLVESHPIRRLGDLVTIRGGGTPSKSDPFYWQGRVPWISPKDMKSRELYDAIDHISEIAIQETAAKLIEPGAVLVVVRGMILAHTFPTAILRAPAAINQDMKALVPTKELLSEFLSSLFWAYNSRVLKLVEKSTHDTRKLETVKLLGTKISVPPLSEQRRIVAYLDNLQAKVDALKKMQEETTIELNALMPSILSKAFAGEL